MDEATIFRIRSADHMKSHAQRIASAVDCLREHTDAMAAFLASLPADAAKRRYMADGWSPAQHGYHVALTTDAFSGVLTRRGAVPAVRGTSEFAEETWSIDTPPIGVVAPAFLIPPNDATLDDVVARLRAAAKHLEAAMHETSADQFEGWAVDLPWGRVSLYQMCDWGGGHTRRHLAQVRRETGM